MSADITTLGLAVDSTQIEQATKKLDGFTQSGQQAEKAAQNLGKATQGTAAGAKTAAQAADMAAKQQRFLAASTDAVGTSTKKADAELRALVKSVENARAAYVKIKGSADGFAESLNEIAASSGKAVSELSKADYDEIARGFGAVAAHISKIGPAAQQATNAVVRMAERYASEMTGMTGTTVRMASSFAGALGKLATISPILGAAAAAAAATVGTILAVGAAMWKVEKENSAFNKALVMSGNAAGATVDELRAVAEATSGAGSTFGAAAEVVSTFASSGKFAVSEIKLMTEAALQLERVGGQSVETTIKHFNELEKDPVKALAKLNAETGFLTAKVFDQVRALVEQGRESEAASIAQQAYAEASKKRASDIVAALDPLESAWLKVGNAAKWAYDKMMGLFRDSPVEAQIAKNVELLGRYEKTIRELQSTGDTSWGPRISQLQSLADNLRVVIATQQDEVNSTKKGAAGMAELRASTDTYISSLQKKDEWMATSGNTAERMAKAIKDAKQEMEAANKAAAATGSAPVWTKKEMEDRLKSIQESFKETGKKAKTSAQEVADAYDKIAKALSKDVAGAINESIPGYDKLNKAQKEFLAVAASPLWASLSDEQRRRIGLYVEEYTAVDDLNKAEKDRLKSAEDQAKAQAAYLSGLEKGIEARNKELQSMSDEMVLLTQGKEAREQVIQQRLDENAAIAEYVYQMTAADNPAAAELASLRKTADQLKLIAQRRRDIRAATASKEAEEANRKSAERAAAEWQKTSDQVGQALADALMEGGKSAAEYIEGLFRAMVLRPIIQAVVQPVANTILGMVGLGGGSGGGALGTANNMASLYSMGSKAYTAFGGSAATASQFVSGYSYGSSLAAGAGGSGATISGGGAGSIAAADSVYAGATTTTAGGSGAAAGASGAATWATWAAVAYIAAVEAQKDWAEGFTTEAAKAMGGPLGPVGDLTASMSTFAQKLGVNKMWADIFSGGTPLAATFGRAAPRVTGQGIQGSFGSGGFEGQAYADVYEKGGWFRHGKAYQKFAEVPEEIDNFMDEAASSILDKAKEYGAALGLPVDALASVTSDIKFQVTDNIEDTKKSVETALAGYGEALVSSWASELKPLSALGETATQTIERVATAIIATNTMLDLLGLSALEASVDGGQAAVALSKMFGGIDGLAQAATTYYDQFYDAGEKAATATRQVTKALEDVGLEMPTGKTGEEARDAFRAIVEGLDLTSESGREQFRVLMNVAGAFAQLNPVIDKTATLAANAEKALGSLANDTASLEAQLQRASGNETGARDIEKATYMASIGDVDDAQRSAIESAYDYNVTLRDQIAALNDAASVLASFNSVIDSLSSQSTSLEAQLLRASGDETGARGLEREQFVSGLDPKFTQDQIAAATALYDYNVAILDSIEAVNLATQAEEQRRAEAERVGEQKKGLERELLELTGDTVAIRALERAEIDESNWALYDRIVALKDARAAEAAAAQAAEDAADAYGVLSKAIDTVMAGLRDNVEEAYRGVESAIRAEQQGISSSIRDLEKGRSDVEREADKQISDLGRQADAATRAFSAIESSLGGLVESLYGVASDIRGVMDEGAQSREQALAVLRKQLGGIVDVGAAKAAASTASQISTSNYASATDYKRDAYKTAILIEDVAAAANRQLSHARAQMDAQLAAIAEKVAAVEEDREAQLVLMDDQLASLGAQLQTLDQQLETAQDQYEALMGIDSSVKSVGSAISSLATAMSAYASALNRTATASSNSDVNNAIRSGAVDVEGTRSWVRKQADNPQVVYDWAVSNKVNSETLDAIMGWQEGSSAQWAEDRGLPKFAAGADYISNDTLAMVHQGERIIPAAENKDLMRIMSGGGRDAALVAEIKALRQEVASLRSESNSNQTAIAANTNKATRILDKWDVDGMPATTA